MTPEAWTTIILGLAIIAVIMCGLGFYQWHYSEPQRRMRAVRQLAKAAGGRR